MAAGPGSTPNVQQAPPTQKVGEVIQCFRQTRRFRPDDNKTYVTSLDFDDTGELAIVARDDDTLQIYNCKEGKHAKELKSQKYGVHLARFSHHAQSIIYASTKVDDTIRYLSTHDNSYIRYFRGHTDTVTCISLSPSSDNFLSCSLDNTVRLWNLQSPNCQGYLNLYGASLATYDPSASVIAIASPPTQSILLYDIRNYDKPPFASFDLQPYEGTIITASTRDWTKLEFSNDGKSLVLSTTGAGHFVLDAFDGTIRHMCVRNGGHSGRKAAGQRGQGVSGQGDVCISPCGQYLIGGSGADGLDVWDLQSPSSGNKILEPFTRLPSHNQGGSDRGAIVGYNPRINLLASADKDLVFWLPDQDLL